MRTKQEAYSLAEKVDAVISEHAGQYPIDSDTWPMWLLYARTIQTSLDVVVHNVEVQRLRLDDGPRARHRGW